MGYDANRPEGLVHRPMTLAVFWTVSFYSEFLFYFP